MTRPDAGEAIRPGDREILEGRARMLARRPTTPSAESTIDVITFTIAGERYAVDVGHVLAVFVLPHAAIPIPGASAPMAGITVWRGNLLTLLDVRSILGLSPSALNDLRNVVVLGDGRGTVGILVDAVVGLETRPVEALQVPAEGTSRPRVRGVWNDAVTLIDGAGLIRHHGTGGLLE